MQGPSSSCLSSASSPRFQPLPQPARHPASRGRRQAGCAAGGLQLRPSSAAASAVRCGRCRRLPPAAALPGGGGSPPGALSPPSTVELLLDKVPGGSELLSPSLDADVRQRAVRAIEQRGGRVTIGRHPSHRPHLVSASIRNRPKSRHSWSPLISCSGGADLVCGAACCAGDVAGTAGLGLDAAEGAVQALAADSLATLQVGWGIQLLWHLPTRQPLVLRFRPWRASRSHTSALAWPARPCCV